MREAQFQNMASATIYHRTKSNAYQSEWLSPYVLEAEWALSGFRSIAHSAFVKEIHGQAFENSVRSAMQSPALHIAREEVHENIHS